MGEAIDNHEGLLNPALKSYLNTSNHLKEAVLRCMKICIQHREFNEPIKDIIESLGKQYNNNPFTTQNQKPLHSQFGNVDYNSIHDPSTYNPPPPTSSNDTKEYDKVKEAKKLKEISQPISLFNSFPDNGPPSIAELQTYYTTIVGVLKTYGYPIVE